MFLAVYFYVFCTLLFTWKLPDIEIQISLDYTVHIGKLTKHCNWFIFPRLSSLLHRDVCRSGYPVTRIRDHLCCYRWWVEDGWLGTVSGQLGILRLTIQKHTATWCFENVVWYWDSSESGGSWVFVNPTRSFLRLIRVFREFSCCESDPFIPETHQSSVRWVSVILCPV